MYSWHPMNAQQCKSYQNIREKQCVHDEAIASSKDRSVAAPNLAKGLTILCVLVKEQDYFRLPYASKYMASLRKKAVVDTSGHEV